jgi:hypothetical protein
MPEGRGSAALPGPKSTSGGATSASHALLFWSAPSERASARAMSSSPARSRNPACGPLSTHAGFAPKKSGVGLVPNSGADVKLSARWCPSTRTRNGASPRGSPKIVKK